MRVIRRLVALRMLLHSSDGSAPESHFIPAVLFFSPNMYMHVDCASIATAEALVLPFVIIPDPFFSLLIPRLYINVYCCRSTMPAQEREYDRVVCPFPVLFSYIYKTTFRESVQFLHFLFASRADATTVFKSNTNRLHLYSWRRRIRSSRELCDAHRSSRTSSRLYVVKAGSLLKSPLSDATYANAFRAEALLFPRSPPSSRTSLISAFMNQSHKPFKEPLVYLSSDSTSAYFMEGRKKSRGSSN